MYKKFFKPALDFALSLLLISVLSPVLIVIALLLFLKNRGAAFFIQERPGLNEKPIYLLKFKTMTDERDSTGKLLPDVKRMTSLGKFLRTYSLDELPQLFNVLKGEMSLIGPRPLLFKYLPLYSEQQRIRHKMKPGITGWAQVNGRNSISWTKKFEYDVDYVKNCSFLLDLKIFWLTFLKVCKREGINQSAERPMKPFDGKN